MPRQLFQYRIEARNVEDQFLGFETVGHKVNDQALVRSYPGDHLLGLREQDHIATRSVDPRSYLPWRFGIKPESYGRLVLAVRHPTGENLNIYPNAPWSAADDEPGLGRLDLLASAAVARQGRSMLH